MARLRDSLLRFLCWIDCHALDRTATIVAPGTASELAVANSRASNVGPPTIEEHDLRLRCRRCRRLVIY